MKVFIQGSTGVLGRRLVRDFHAEGHEVVGLVRSGEGEKAVRSLGGSPSRADVFDAAALTKAAEGCDVVIRAATAIPKSGRVSAAAFRATAELRTEGTKALLAAAVRSGARTFLQESIVWVARPRDGSPFNEDSPVLPDAITAPVIEAEHLARSVGGDGKITATTLRLGNVYAPDAWHTRFMGERLSRHKLPIIGRGDSTLSLIHADDASRAFLAAALRPRSGTFHVVDDEPAATGEFLPALAAKLGARAPTHIPPWLARLAAGRYVAEFFTVPMRTSNRRFRGAFAWAPTYPTYREGLDQVVAEWRKEGYLMASAPP